MTGTGSSVDRRKKHLRQVYQAAVHIFKNIDYVHSQIYDHEKRVNPNHPKDDLELAITMFSYLLQKSEDTLYLHQLKRARARLEELVSDDDRFELAFRTGSIGWNPDKNRFAAIENCLETLKELYTEADQGLARNDHNQDADAQETIGQEDRKKAVSLTFLLNQYIAKYRGFPIDFNHLAVSEYNMANQTEDQTRRRQLYEQALLHDFACIQQREGRNNDISHRNTAVYYDKLSSICSDGEKAGYIRKAVLAQTTALKSPRLKEDPQSWYWLGIYQNKLALQVHGDWEEKVSQLSKAEESLSKAVRLRGNHDDHRELAYVYLNIASSTMEQESARYNMDLALVHMRESLRIKDDADLQKKLAEAEDSQRYSS